METLEWTVADKRDETDQVQTIVLEPAGEPISFIAGQYLTVLLPGHEPAEGKSYSISSAPYESQVTLTIKRMGSFSNALLDLPIGSQLSTSPPYGFFYPEPDDEGALVFLAGGIGITPIWSILKQLEQETDQRPRHLFYSNATEQDIVFRKGLEVAGVSEFLTVTNHITQTEPQAATHTAGRMTAESIFETADPQTATFFLCGSTSFTKGVWQMLRAAGIRTEQLYTEGFF